MQSDRPPSERGIARQSSQSTVRFRDADSATIASQMASTSPTSLPLPLGTDRSSNASFANQQFIVNSNTAPTLAGSHISRRHGAFRSSATWTSSSGDLAMFSDTDEIEDRTRFVLEYNRLAKKVRVSDTLSDLADFSYSMESESWSWAILVARQEAPSQGGCVDLSDSE